MKKKGPSNMERTLRFIEKMGWVNYWVVEKFSPFSGRKNDLFNIIDLLIVTENKTIGVQSCGADFSPHVKKIMEDEIYFTKVWLKPKHNQLWLIGWRRMKVKRGSEQMDYFPRIAHIKYSKKTDSLILTELPVQKGNSK